MKWQILVIFSAMLSAATQATAATGPVGVNLAAMHNWDIVVSPDAIASEFYAAEEFRDHFAKAAGVRLPIVKKVDRPRDHIFIGLSDAMKVSNVGFDIAGLGDEDLRIVIRDGNIAIAGGRPRGTLYGVYSFCEDYLGIRYLTHDHTHIPPVGDWRVVGPIDRVYRPPLSFRWSHYGEIHQHSVFSARVRCNSANDEKLGGASDLRLINHTFYSLIPTTHYGQEHPEYFALIDGERQSKVAPHRTDPCLTNPEVLDIVTNNVLEQIKANPELTNISVSQNDGRYYCRCDECTAINEREGTLMGTLLTFVNAVADRVKVEHPDIKVGTLSYSYSRHPPKTIKARDNVMIQLASMECSVVQPINDPNSKANAGFCRDLRVWGSLCDHISVWNYNTNFMNYLLPCPNLRVIEPNIRFFVANNVRGIFMQAAGGVLGGELSDLRNYMTCRLMWNPTLSGEKLMNEFLDLHYRSAAAPIRRFINLVHDNAESKGIEKNCFGDAEDYGIDDTIVQAGLNAFNEAMGLANDDFVRARVEKASVCAYRAAVEDAWLWVLQNYSDLDKKFIPADVAKRTRPYLKRLFELCDTHNVMQWSEPANITKARELLRRAFGLKEGESF